MLFVGYQAPGRLGRLLVDRAERVSLLGTEVAVSARIRSLDLSWGHADKRGQTTHLGARGQVGKGGFSSCTASRGRTPPLRPW